MEQRYSMLIQWSAKDQAYITTLPEFGGCKTHGVTYEDAAKNGLEVLELLVETYEADGRPLPVPACHDDKKSARKRPTKAVPAGKARSTKRRKATA